MSEWALQAVMAAFLVLAMIVFGVAAGVVAEGDFMQAVTAIAGGLCGVGAGLTAAFAIINAADEGDE